MGYAYKWNIEKAAEFLVLEMIDVNHLDFLYFYSEDETKRDELDRETGIGEDALCYLECAIGQLEENGVVETTKLDTVLPDGEFDYRIAWTRDGRELVVSVEGWKFCHLCL